MSLNGKDNRIYLREQLEQILHGCPSAVTESADALKRYLGERKPVVYLLQCGGSEGDRLPALNVFKWLITNLDCEFYFFAAWNPVQCPPTLARSGIPQDKYKVYPSLEELLRKGPPPDVIYTNQMTKMDRHPQWASAVRMLHLKIQLFGPLWIEVEHSWLENGFIEPNARHLVLMRERKETLVEFRKWRKTAKINMQEAKDQSKKLPHVRLEAFPSEMLTESELQYSEGILSSWVPSIDIMNICSEEVAMGLSHFIVRSRLARKIIIYMGRGGRTLGDLGMRAAMTALLHKRDDIVIVAFDNVHGREIIGDHVTEKLASKPPVVEDPRVHWVVFGKLYMPQWFRFFDLVVHHGGCGTLMTGLLGGVPGIVIPDEVDDQVRYGMKLEALGCGILLQPRKAEDMQHKDIVVAVETIIQNYPRYKQSCDKWQAILEKNDGLELTCDTIMRLIVGFLKQPRKVKNMAAWRNA